MQLGNEPHPLYIMGKRSSKLNREQLDELTASTHFTANELNRWYKGFINDCPSGTINKEEFCKIYRQFFPFGESEKFATHLFNTFNVNQDGLVDFKEFVRTLSTTSRGTLVEKLEWTFHLYDSDKDGYISRREMELIVESMHKMVGHLVSAGEGEMEDYNEEQLPQKRVDKLFKTMDQDGDERISLAEFLEAAKNDPVIMEGLSHYEEQL